MSEIPRLSRLLPRPQLRAVIYAEDRHGGIVADLDPMHHDVGQAGHHQIARARQGAFASDVWIDAEKLNRFANARADLARSLGISFSDEWAIPSRCRRARRV